ncbi:phage antirepressor [Corynebacterium dentalis]|uniref:phage antirepressor n=1 Tax=Corynebacterium dentalis TaxID=2014528 RepID=UPI0028995D9E|nr:phage antirepressor [Corynebacterium dentalis]
MKIEPFNFNGLSVRVIVGEEAEPEWVATDVAKILGYRDAANLARRLDEDEKGTHSVSTPGGYQQLTTITESGLYSAILGSKRPEAREFKRWVTHEVLPSIRKRGGYLTPEATEAALTDPDFIIRLATDLKLERARRAELESQAAEDAPKVLFANAVSTSNTDILVGDLAKILKGNGVNIGANRLFIWLRANGYLISRKGTDWNMPTQRSMELGLFRVKETAVTHSDGHVSVNKTPKVTGKGQQYFVDRFLSGRFAA